MLALPWWILGVNPDETDDEPEFVTGEHEEVEEAEEESSSSSVLLYRTPSASPLCESIDQLPKVVDVSTFMNVAKRRSSSRMEEWISPKMRKTGERKSFVRNETEIMNKTVHGNSIEETDGKPVNSSRSGSPMPFNGDIFNETFFLDDNNNQVDRSEQSSSEESPRPRDFPLFFTSFDDTTVLFNTTITGDIDLNERNDAVGDWVFKNNKFLSPASPKAGTSGSGDNVFKEPKKRGRKPRVPYSPPANMPSSSPAPIKTKEEKVVEKKQKEEEPKVEEEPKKVESKKKKAEPKKKDQEKKEEEPKKKDQEKKEEEPEQDVIVDGPYIPITPTRAPSLARRHTPSRKVKTYKSLRE